MNIKAVSTEPILAGQQTIFEILDNHINDLEERTIVVITSKIIALCENRVFPIEGTDREKLIRDNSSLYYDPKFRQPGLDFSFSIVKNTLIPSSGVDASNTDNLYVLWPEDSIRSANEVRAYLKQRFNLKHVGVIISDSTIGLSRWGTIGIPIGHSGFDPIKDYVGTKDIFGRTLEVSSANMAGSLCAGAVAVMGEGAECTPIAILSDLPQVDFKDADPSDEEIAKYYISPLDDLVFKSFFTSVKWEKGGLPK